eukprot:TRINITY_DN275_c0_g1_i7.p1 TRINITY_DN275_c0_g1~~TRINITY_DN275_c0_g1_i7.p1  ORF type:complete len:223 (-),score=26.25 TRINITY_DN275_c0_g1_i7:1123-1791(-)
MATELQQQAKVVFMEKACQVYVLKDCQLAKMMNNTVIEQLERLLDCRMKTHKNPFVSLQLPLTTEVFMIVFLPIIVEKKLVQRTEFKMVNGTYKTKMSFVCKHAKELKVFSKALGPRLKEGGNGHLHITYPIKFKFDECSQVLHIKFWYNSTIIDRDGNESFFCEPKEKKSNFKGYKCLIKKKRTFEEIEPEKELPELESDLGSYWNSTKQKKSYPPNKVFT